MSCGPPNTIRVQDCRDFERKASDDSVATSRVHVFRINRSGLNMNNEKPHLVGHQELLFTVGSCTCHMMIGAGKVEEA